MGESAVKHLGKISILFAFSVISLAACSSGPDEDVSPVVRAPEPAPSTAPQPYQPPSEAPAPPPPAYHPVASDQCGAATLQSLIGKPRTDIPVPLHPENRRVICSTCVMTQEYRADRQTIIFDSDTGLITSVKCG